MRYQVQKSLEQERERYASLEKENQRLAAQIKQITFQNRNHMHDMHLLTL